MTALGDVATQKVAIPALGITLISAVTAATVDDGDTFTVDLSDYGCTNIHGIIGFQEGTTGSVITTEAPTTSVSSSTLTVTVGGGDDNKVRSFLIWAY
jgi:hypothetical protein